MANTLSVSVSGKFNQETFITGNTSATGTDGQVYSNTVANGVTGGATSILPFSKANCKGFLIASDQDISVEFTGASGTTFTVSAGSVVYWLDDGNITNPLVDASVTGMTVTNASGSTANLTVRILLA